jgi:hypothetical protein
MMPLRCPSSWRIVVRRSYLPEAAPVVARKAVVVRVWSNSVLSSGVVSMNQPRLLPSVSRVRVPELGRLLVSYPVIVPEASCPVGRSWISILRLNGAL